VAIKGGVGKTTITVGIAEMLVAEHGMRVLVIDLDPQTDATVSLIDEQVKSGRTSMSRGSPSHGRGTGWDRDGS
jgi:chromosome partitioning protein